MSVDVIVEEGRWGAIDLAALVDRSTRATLHHLGIDPNAHEIAVLATDDAAITRLNFDFRGKDRPTNVLSWPSEARSATDPGEIPPRPTENAALGDIALGYETCAREALAAGTPLHDHVAHLIVHGTLHLLGYDHQRNADADLMETTEIEILAKLGVPSPYDGNGAVGVIDDGKD